MNDLFSVAGKVAVVTGGSRGIGAMIARGFVESGARTYIAARNIDELKATENTLSKSGDCIAIRSDLSTLQGIVAFAKQLLEREPKIDILLNNAGTTWGQNIEEFPETGWDKVMDMNVKAPFFIIQQLLPSLREAGNKGDPARIINITSINALINPKQPNYSYSASKAALIHMTRHLAADLVQDNINVNGIAPGLFPSRMTAFLIDAHEETIGAFVPRGRIGNDADAAGAAIYLSAKASAWMTGHTLVLDGGSSACAG